jgi:hypothetical protein
MGAGNRAAFKAGKSNAGILAGAPTAWGAAKNTKPNPPQTAIKNNLVLFDMQASPPATKLNISLVGAQSS